MLEYDAKLSTLSILDVGHLAQLVELSLDVRAVRGSSPLVSTIICSKKGSVESR